MPPSITSRVIILAFGDDAAWSHEETPNSGVNLPVAGFSLSTATSGIFGTVFGGHQRSSGTSYVSRNPYELPKLPIFALHVVAFRMRPSLQVRRHRQGVPSHVMAVLERMSYWVMAESVIFLRKL